jgi:transcriptional regulator of arginine metabolism
MPPVHTKLQRQGLVQQILSERAVGSQVELAKLLRSRHVRVTQATISRDLAELGASLIRDQMGELRYELRNEESATIAPAADLDRVVSEHVTEVRCSGDLIVLVTPPARAPMVAYALDRARLGDSIGTIAGDDTVLLIAKPGRGAAVESRLRRKRNR